jgi:hypothetical protein
LGEKYNWSNIYLLIAATTKDKKKLKRIIVPLFVKACFGYNVPHMENQ